VVDARIIDTPGRALDLKIDLTGVFLAMRGSFAFGGRTLAIDGGITADLHATARLVLGTAADGAITVGVTGVTATIGPLVPGFVGSDGEELDALIRLGGASFRTLIEGLISDQLIPAFTGRLPPLLESLLGAADQLLDHLELTLMPGTLTAGTVKDLIGTIVWPQLFGAIGDKLRIQLPLPDLAALGLGDLAPGLASAQLMLQMQQRPAITAGRLVLGADLVLSTPPP
jgi:hypothetical protein